MLAYQFDEDYGARENLSILYNDVLVVVATKAQQKAVDTVIEAYISFNEVSMDGQFFDNDFDRAGLIQALAAAGFTAEWLTPNIYINEDC